MVSLTAAVMFPLELVMAKLKLAVEIKLTVARIKISTAAFIMDLFCEKYETTNVVGRKVCL